MKLNPIKTVLSACVLFFAFLMTNPASAQDKAGMADMIKNSTPEQRAQMQTGMMKTKLSLDTIQVVKVQAINLVAAQKMDPILKSSGRKFAMLKQLKEIDEQKDKDLKAVLTADQYKQYETAKEEMKEKMKEKMQQAKAAKS